MGTTVAEHLALAVAVGAIATTADGAAPAIVQRRDALVRAIGRRSTAIRLDDVHAEPTSRAFRVVLAQALEEHGAATDPEILTTAKEVLALVNLDDGARTAVGTSMAEVEPALVALAAVDIEALSEALSPIGVEAEPPAKAVVAPTTSRRLFGPPPEPSKTDLERDLLPVWQRTERFFTKALILVAIVGAGAIAWCALERGSKGEIDACRSGDTARCWQAVIEADAVEHGRGMPDEPLRLLCDRDQDACACAGLAYVVAAQTSNDSLPACDGLAAATALDPRWPCTCRNYEFWRVGKQRLPQCEVPRCN